tara:strand:- start:1482 stop:2447 length:966 start_codon:yes stop_codon:yes gene_type:complete
MFQILTGDCVELMKKMDGESVDMCVTSPPYWGLRDYGHGESQLGLEATPEEYIDNMVKVFREVKRVLKPEGTLWLNIGDSYNGSGGSGGDYNKGGIKEGQPKYGKKNTPSLKPKDLVGIPWMLAFALRADGWWLRQDIIWAKPSCMPESVTDRCTKNHEYVFLLSKNKDYYYDHEAIKEDTVSKADKRKSAFTYADNEDWAKDKDASRISKAKGIADARVKQYAKRNKRSVWWVSPKPFPEAHFAVFPVELIEPCILAGCPADGLVLDPFGGAGTTAIAAIKHGRNALLCEYSCEYVEIAHKRILGYQQELGHDKADREWF